MRENRFSPNFQERLDQSVLARLATFSMLPKEQAEEKAEEIGNIIQLKPAALRKGLVYGLFDKAKGGVLAAAAVFVMAGCGPTATATQGPAVTTEKTAQQDVSTYAKYLTTLTFPTEDPNHGWKAHKGGKVEAYLAEFYGATGEDDVFNPQRDAVSYEIRKDSKFADRYNPGFDFFKKLNTGLGSYPDDDPWVHTRSPRNEVVEFKTLTREGWNEFFKAHGGEYVPQPTGTPEPSAAAGTPAQAEPTATTAESSRATSVPAAERLPGGLRPWYIKTATDGDPRVAGNYARSAETNPALQRFFKEQGRQHIEEIGVTTVRNAARFIAERVPGVSEQALAAVFKPGEHKIAYRASDGTVKFTSVIVGEKTDEATHQISQDEEVLAFKIVYPDGREAIRLLRIMCIQEFEEEVPVVRVTPTPSPTPEEEIVPTLTLTATRTATGTATGTPIPPRPTLPITPNTPEAIPTPTQTQTPIPPPPEIFVCINGVQYTRVELRSISFLARSNGYIGPEDINSMINYLNSKCIPLPTGTPTPTPSSTLPASSPTATGTEVPPTATGTATPTKMPTAEPSLTPQPTSAKTATTRPSPTAEPSLTPQRPPITKSPTANPSSTPGK